MPSRQPDWIWLAPRVYLDASPSRPRIIWCGRPRTVFPGACRALLFLRERPNQAFDKWALLEVMYGKTSMADPTDVHRHLRKLLEIAPLASHLHYADPGRWWWESLPTPICPASDALTVLPPQGFAQTSGGCSVPRATPRRIDIGPHAVAPTRRDRQG